MESPIETQMQKNNDESESEKEKRILFLIQIGREYYESHLKQVKNATTTSGFIITVNGIIILACINFIQFAISKNNQLPDPRLIVILSTMPLILSAASIFLSILFMHIIRPISHDLSEFSQSFEPIPYSHLLVLDASTMFMVSENNSKRFDKYYNLFYSWSIICLSGSIGFLIALIIRINMSLY